MKKRLKLKAFVVPTLYTVAAVCLILSIFLMTKTLKNVSEEEDLNYVSNVVTEQDVPVVNVEKTMIRPYADSNVKVAKYFYDRQSEQQKQESSIIYHENTYMQNSGVDYQADNVFDVLAITDGTVIEIQESELLGKIVKIRHENDLISVYQSLSEVTVKKDDKVTQGQALGKSGKSVLSSELNNHLHFELYHKGQVVDPETCYDKKISDL